MVRSGRRSAACRPLAGLPRLRCRRVCRGGITAHSRVMNSSRLSNTRPHLHPRLAAPATPAAAARGRGPGWPTRATKAGARRRAGRRNRGGRRPAASQHAIREGAGGLQGRLVVEQRQRLERRVGAVALRAGRRRVGGVEDRQAGVRRGSPEERVHAAPVAVAAEVGDPVLRHLREAVDALRLRREDAGPADGRREQPARRERHVADDLRLEAEAILPRQQEVARILLVRVRPGDRRLAVDRAGQQSGGASA